MNYRWLRRTFHKHPDDAVLMNYQVKTMLGKDLEPGMLIKEGLVVSVDVTDNDTFWKSPHVTLLRVEDAHYGLLGAQLDLEEEFEIVYERGSRKYQESLHVLFCELMDAAKARAAESEKVLSFLK